MDEEYSESIDTSADTDLSDTGVAEDISDNIPDDVLDDIPEDDFSNVDVPDDFSEDLSDATVDNNEYEEAGNIGEDATVSEDEGLNEFIDDLDEDIYEEADASSESNDNSDDILEDLGEIEESLEDGNDAIEDISEDIENNENIEFAESFEEDVPEDITDIESEEDAEDTDNTEQPENVVDAEVMDEPVDAEDSDSTEQPEDAADAGETDETVDIGDTDTAEQPGDVVDAEVMDEPVDAEDSDSAEQPEDATDAEETDETVDVGDTDTVEQPGDEVDAEVTDEPVDAEDSDSAEQPEDVTDAKATDETVGAENTDTVEQPVDQSNLETYDYETSPEILDSDNPEMSGEFVSSDNPYRERWEQFGKEFSNDSDEIAGWDSLKDVPFGGTEQLDTDGIGDGSEPADARDDQGNYPTLKSMEGKEYFDAAKSSYDRAEDVAGESDLRFFKAHDMDHHIDKVIERSAEASDVIEGVTDIKCDKKDLAAAALYHDTGMDGGYKYEASDGNGIRKNHPMSSAVHALTNREALENDGCNADQVAALTLLHSKSCSGVKDLSDNEQIESAFDKLQSEVDEYNLTHSDNPLTFRKEAIDVERFKYNAASLRLGDAFGHDSSSTKTQSGGFYDIDFGEDDALSHDEWDKDYWKDEIEESSLTFHDHDETYNIDDSNDPEGLVRMYQFGEGNIAAMHSKIGDDGEFQSVIDVKNGMAKPLCTQECVLERLKELETTKKLFRHSTTINLYGDLDEKHMALYESFSRENESSYGRIQINYLGGKYNGNV